MLDLHDPPCPAAHTGGYGVITLAGPGLPLLLRHLGRYLASVERC
jgi:hypothetical protein